MWSSRRRSKGGSKPPCFKFSTTGPSKCAWVGKACRAVDRRARGRERESERAKRDETPGGSVADGTGRDETREDERREWEREKNSGAWAVLPAAFCWIGFREVFGGTGWLAGRPSVRRQGLKKGGAKRQTRCSKTCTAFQTLAKPHY
jgi:hypothetical protein